MRLRGLTAAAILALVASLTACGNSGDTTADPPPTSPATAVITTVAPEEPTTTINGETYTCAQMYAQTTPCSDGVQALFNTYKDNINAYLYDEDLAEVFSLNPDADVSDIVFGGLAACHTLAQEGVATFRQYVEGMATSERSRTVIPGGKSYALMWFAAAEQLCPEHVEEAYGTNNPGGLVVD